MQATIPAILETAQREKLTSLEEAIAEHIQPGVSIFLPTEGRAAVRALCKHFWKQRPELTLIALRIGASHCVDLLYCGAAKRVIGSSFGLQYPSFQPSSLMQHIYKQSDVEIECWSLMSLVQRLMAGALGVPFLPTRSMTGSDLAKEGNIALREICDPFGGAPISVLKALNPEITFVHALAADIFGNAIAPSPEDDLWSARAATKGCIVLAENIVSSDMLRQHSNLVRIPAYKTLAVCHVPFASHPDGYESGVKLSLTLNNYRRDTVHYQNYYEASLTPERFDKWLEQWVQNIDSQDDYLDKVGRLHLDKLCESPPDANWRHAYELIPNAPPAEEIASLEMMFIATSRVIEEIVTKQGLVNCLVGAGSAEIAAALALYVMRSKKIDFNLVNGVGPFGYEPLPIEQAKRLTAIMLSNTVDIYGTIVGGVQSRCLSVVGAGEIDVNGNINSTKSKGRFLVGSGGVNDAITCAAQTIVMMPQSARRMVPRVEYITCPGERVLYLVTDHGVFRKNNIGAFELWRFYKTQSNEDAIEFIVQRAQESCGWKVELSPDLASMSPATAIERRLLLWLDPKGRSRSKRKNSD